MHLEPFVPGTTASPRPWLALSQNEPAEPDFEATKRLIWLRPKPRKTSAAAPALPDLDKALVNPAAVFRSPDEVVRHPLLTVNCKREILQRWAWDEYLLELATNEAMPEGEPSRLDEVKCALLVLDEERGPDPAAPAMRAIVLQNWEALPRAA